jgi:hypothetical protein
MDVNNFCRVVLIFCLILSCFTFGYSSPIWIPETVGHKIDSLFPGIAEIHWKKHHRRFIADFVYHDSVYSYSFNKQGEIVACLKEIPLESLPDNAIAEFRKHFKGFKILMVLLDNHNGRINYEIEIMQGRNHYTLRFNSRGYLSHQYEMDKTDIDKVYVD